VCRRLSCYYQSRRRRGERTGHQPTSDPLSSLTFSFSSHSSQRTVKMLRTALPRPALSSTPSSCSCKRTAATLPTSSTSFPSTPPPIPSVYAQTPAISPPTVDNPHWNDPAYLARYRSPVRHDSGRRFETFANPKPRSEDAPRRPSVQAQRQPRSRENRLEMERLWSGGDFSPPIPDASYKTQTTRPSHALLYPGSYRLFFLSLPSVP
jgi:hypothetical protein